MSDVFSWNSSDQVFPTTYAVAVYRHADGDLVIRQAGAYGDDDDVIFIPMHNIPILLEALSAQYMNWEVDG